MAEFLLSFANPELLKHPIYQFLLKEFTRLHKSSKYSPVSLNLHRLLTEVNFTKDPKLQLELLTKVQSWYISLTSQAQPQIISLTPKVQKAPVVLLERTSESIAKKNFIYLPKRYRLNESSRKSSFNKEKSQVSVDALQHTRASSSEPVKRDKIGKVCQSPSIIRSIVNDFVKVKRGKMYNFTLEAFLASGKAEAGRKVQRPMSTSMKRQFDEVENIKYKLANKKIPCGVDVVFQAIVVEDTNALESDYSKLPKGGECLLKAK